MKLIRFISLHNTLNKFGFLVIFELSIIFLVTISLGMVFNGLYFDNRFSFIYIVLLVVSLYYGIIAGIILDLMYVVFCVFYEKMFPLDFVINSLMVVIVAGEFHFYYNLKISSLRERVEYLEARLREIGRGALFTKLSHDYLEESYLAKPYSLRSLILELSKKNNIEDFLEFLKSKFHLKEFAYIEDKNVYGVGIEEVDFKDTLIEEMYEKKDIVFFKEAKGKYLASIPVFDLKDEIKAFILIKKLPFIHYSEENLLAIQLVSNFFYLKKIDFSILNSLKDNPFCKIISCYSLAKLNKLYKLYKVSNAKSSLILIETTYLYSDILENFLIENLRALDFFEKIERGNKIFFLIILPFTNKIGAKYFLERLFKVLELEEKNRYYIFEIKDFEKVLKLAYE